MKKILSLSLLAATLVIAFGGRASADLINGGFSDANGPLYGWTSQNASVDGQGVAVMEDGSYLYQGFSVVEEWNTFSFEFDPTGLSPAFLISDPFGFPDAFYVTLYFTSNPNEVPPTSNASPIMSADNPNGFYDMASGILVRPLGAAGWTSLTYTFRTDPGTWVFPYFELVNYDESDTNSHVLLDNVSITASAVPEPSTMLLLAAGLTMLSILGRIRTGKRRSTQG